MNKWEFEKARQERPFPAPVYVHQEPSGATTTLETDVTIPAAQAVIISAAWGALAGFLSGIVVAWQKWPWWIVLTVGFAVGLLLLALKVTNFIGERRALMWKRERVEGRDIDGDGHIGKPRTTTVEVIDRRRGRIRYVDIPLSDDQLETLARAVLVDNVEWSRRKLAEAGALSEERYQRVVAPMLKGGLLAYRGDGHQAGLEVTPTGRAFLRQYLD